MSNQSKKIFLALSIAIPFILYSVYYYSIMIKNAPYKFSEFESLTFRYGVGDSLMMQYTSQTGKYIYLNRKDSLVETHVKLTKDDLLYLHRKAADLGFWDFPSELISDKKEIPYYYLELRYKRKSKHVLFESAYDKDLKLKEAVKILMGEVSRTINDAEDRRKKAQ